MTSDIHLGTREDGTPCDVPISDFDYHAQFIGPTQYGKTRAIANVVQQLILKRRDAAFVVVDPKGDLYDLLKGWAYEKALDRRLVLLDVREPDHVLGFNPLKPNPSLDPVEQTALQFEIISRSLEIADQQTAVVTRERDAWMKNTLLALIQAQLTYRDAPALLDPNDGSLRDRVLPCLPPSDMRRDFLGLHEQTPKLISEKVTASLIQFRTLIDNRVAKNMYACDRTIDFRRVFDERRILLVRLAPEDNVIGPIHQKLLGMQVVNEVIREVFARSPANRVPTYCVIDEAGRFATNDVTQILDQGGYRLSLLMAHQQCDQLIRKDKDRSLLNSVLTNTRIKFVAGGLGQDDAKIMADTINRHHLDPDKPHIAAGTLRQLSRVVEVESMTRGVQEGEAFSSGAVSTTSTSAGSAHRSPTRTVSDLGDVNQHLSLTTPDGGDYSSGAGRADSEIDMHTTNVGRSEAKTTGPAVHPTEPFMEYPRESIDNQQHRFTSKMIKQEPQYQVVTVRKTEPVLIRVADVPNPKFTAGQIRHRDRRLIQRNPELYVPVSEIPAMIERRHDRLSSHAEVVDDQSPAPLPEPDPFRFNDPLPEPTPKRPRKSTGRARES